MAEIMKYTPTVGMVASERNEAGYYAVIKSWVQEHTATFEKWFTVAYYDTSHIINFTPIAENIGHKYFEFYFYSSTLTIRYAYSSSSNRSVSVDLSADEPIYLYDGDDFFIGGSTQKCFCGVFRGKKFDDNSDISVFIGCYSGYFEVYYKQSSSYDYSNSTAYRRNAASTDTYVVQKFIIEGTSIIMVNVFYLDSGMSLPPANDFKIGDTKYCRLVNNFVTKL